MCRQVSVRYDWSDTTTPGRARRFCAAQLRELLPEGPALGRVDETAELVISELVTNSVAAGSDHVEVTIAVHRDHLLLDVSDDAIGLPRRRHSPADDPHGRGLAVVEQLSREWGVTPMAEGKHTWARLPLPAELADRAPCHLTGS